MSAVQWFLHLEAQHLECLNLQTQVVPTGQRAGEFFFQLKKHLLGLVLVLLTLLIKMGELCLVTRLIFL